MNTLQESRIRQHGENLLAIFPNATERDPVKLCKQLRRLEVATNRAAVQCCNGEIDGGEWDAVAEVCLDALDARLDWVASGVPVIVNGDPRGYALKINDEWMRKNTPHLHRDWGGYGIIAPEIDGKP